MRRSANIIMNRYEITAQIGDGTFGRVMKARHKDKSSTTVAIKQIKKKMTSWKECIDLREIQTLREISHPNIVTLLEVILENDGSLYFVFEYMADGSLYELTKSCIESKSTLSNARVIDYVKQILQGLQFLHDEKHCFHRDIKPENVLVSGDTIKLADFGLARSLIDSNPQLTYYVSTRWYRAPEVILRASCYGPPIDLYATGLIMAELYSLQPLLPGSSEIDQIKLMIDLIGQPPNDWEEGIELMERLKLVTPSSPQEEEEEKQVGIESRIQQRLPKGKDVSSAAANLIASLLQWNPIKRPSAQECLRHELFQPPKTSHISQREIREDKDEKQTQQVVITPATVKRSNRKRGEVPTQNLAQRLSLKRFREVGEEDVRDQDESGNEFSDYLAAVSMPRSREGHGSFPSLGNNSRAGNKIRPLLFEKENRNFPGFEDGLSNRHDTSSVQGMDGCGYAQLTWKKKNSNLPNRRKKLHGHTGVTSLLGRGIGVQISNPHRHFLPTLDDDLTAERNVANIWNKSDETNTERGDGNQFCFD